VIAGVLALNRPLPEYLVAESALRPGEQVGLERFEVQRLDLGSLRGNYLTPQTAPERFFVTELILAGELIPTRRVSDLGSQNSTTLVLNPSLPVSQEIKPGSWVQIWRTVPSPEGFVSELLVARSQVLTISQDDSLISDKESLAEVLVTEEEASILLQTIASDLHVYLLLSTLD
jgi:hypothetical protein